MTFATRGQRWAEQRADEEHAAGIPNRQPVTDSRDVIDLDLRTHGGKHWRIEPRLGYTSCRLRNVETGEVECCGTAKQIMRHLSANLPHRLGARNLQ